MNHSLWLINAVCLFIQWSLLSMFFFSNNMSSIKINTEFIKQIVSNWIQKSLWKHFTPHKMMLFIFFWVNDIYATGENRHQKQPTIWNYLPKLSPHSVDDIKCSTKIPNSKRPAAFIVTYVSVFYDYSVYVSFGTRTALLFTPHNF